MAPRCTICENPDRDAIDRALAGGTATMRGLARRYCGTARAEDAMWRHAHKHLPETLVDAIRVQESMRAEALVNDLLGLRDRLGWILDRAEERQDDAAALRAIGEARKLVETMGRIVGLIKPVEMSVNVAATVEFSELVAVVLAPLEAHPDARLAVVHALEEAQRAQHR